MGPIRSIRKETAVPFPGPPSPSLQPLISPSTIRLFYPDPLSLIIYQAAEQVIEPWTALIAREPYCAALITCGPHCARPLLRAARIARRPYCARPGLRAARIARRPYCAPPVLRAARIARGPYCAPQECLDRVATVTLRTQEAIEVQFVCITRKN